MPDRTVERIEPRQASINAAIVYSGLFVAQTGIQLIAPTLPALRDAFGISDAQLALVTSLYLLPAALAAIPAGILADRIGRRKVFGWSMIALGASGVALQFASASFPLFLAIRVVQGTAFAGMMPLTMTILGDAFSGAALIRAHGRRTVANHISDGSLPILGGLIVAFGWQVPWLGQIIAIPFGILVLSRLTDPPFISGKTHRRVPLAEMFTEFKTLPIIGLQFLGFLRMFLKFGIVTFIPLLLVDHRDLSLALAGLIVGTAALVSAVPAMIIGVTGGSSRPARQVMIAIAVAGVGLLALAHAPTTPLLLAAAVTFGAADGLAGVYINAFVSAATGPEQRGRFTAATGAIRNFAKFLAPTVLGALTLVGSLVVWFSVIAVLTSASAFLAIPMRELEPRLADQRAAT